MRLTAVASVSAVLLSAGAVDAQTRSPAPAAEISAADARKHVGEEVTICGPVVTYACKTPDGTLSLDLISPSWTNGVSVTIARQDWNTFGGTDLVQRSLAASVCATGILKRERSRFHIAVRRPDQLRVARASEVVAPEHATARLACEEGVKAPVLRKEVRPDYTRLAMSHRQQGRVLLDPIVRPDGSVSEVRVLYGIYPDYGLNDEAIKAVSQWRFQPGTIDGRPVPVVVLVEMAFILKEHVEIR